MPEGLGRIRQVAWLRRLARGLGLSVLLTVGGAGWQLARWHDATLSTGSILVSAESVASLGPPEPRTSAEPAEAEPMPEPVAEAEPELAAPELHHISAVLHPAVVSDPLSRVSRETKDQRPETVMVAETLPPEPDTALPAVLDPRDRSVVPPLASCDGEMAKEEDAPSVAQPALDPERSEGEGPRRPVSGQP